MKKFKKCRNSSRIKKNFSTKIKKRKNDIKCKLFQCLLKDISQILSPQNTTQYLMENNSSPFYSDENEENDFDINLELNPLLSLDSGNTICSLIKEDQNLKKSYSELEFSSTAPQSQEMPKFSFIY